MCDVDAPAEVAPGVFRLGTSWVNWYLVEEGGRYTAIDAAVSGYGDTLEEDLAKIGARPEDVEAVVLTHADADHTGLAGRLSEAGARVLVHGDAQDMLRRPRPKGGDAKPVKLVPHLWRPTVARLFLHFARNGAARPPSFDGAISYEAGQALDVPGRPRAIATPGHAAGHCALHLEERGVLFAGDALCTFNVVTGSRGAQLMPRAMNEDNDRALQSLGAVEELDAQVVLPGHGDPFEGPPDAAVAAARSRI
jgi:glyoxylase-like metal-dependent hydrolase (beta-lactamase superfamily II)